MITALDCGTTVESVSERIYNCETGWGGGRAICFVEHPLFLVSDPALLCRKWAQIPQPIER